MNEQSKVVLLKKVDLFKQQIQKFNANDVVMNLQVCLDVSGSMHAEYRDWETDRQSTRLNSSHSG